MSASNRDEMMKKLDFFIGHWDMEVTHPHIQPNPILGHSSIEWMEEKYIIQRIQINKSEFPSSTTIYDWDAKMDQYVMHYFDSRGVTRLYQMTLGDGVWKWWRDKADFSSLKFFQRSTGKVDETGTVIESILEKSDDGINWEHDFKTVYRKVEEQM
ncbi:hypothetical protein QWY14_13505 [Planococcus sp. N028]|uniref:DUF1579 domain-containing protein n=1 Tax=Planococcus shixiaomingii TaxID=3058393 RepID=A0ABT8N521_9BACL|nr:MULTISPECIES: hypothetical protein [unclassified Planococcus (in: firmicutes)]MDN7242824.1 hypothetical protein [Planococcus sp. N028]WKA55552.1 hypothetical protein QWY21_03975 [Planococcus sp. N022]